jgi:hypothetical protein
MHIHIYIRTNNIYIYIFMCARSHRLRSWKTEPYGTDWSRSGGKRLRASAAALYVWCVVCVYVM